MSISLLLADKIMGTNVSGLNGPVREHGIVRVREEEFDRMNNGLELGQKLFDEVEQKKEQIRLLHEQIQQITERHKQETLSFIDAKNNKLGAVLDVVYEKVGSSISKVSETAKAEYFVRTQFYNLAQRFGIEKGKNIDFIRKNLDLNQKFTFNVYMIATADYMVFQNYIASIIAAMTEVIQQAKQSDKSPFFGNTEFISNLTDVKDALMIDLVNVSRIDSDTYKVFHKKRVGDIAKSATLISGTTDIDPSSVPSITVGIIDDTLKRFRALEAIKQKIQDEDVRNALRSGSDEALMPSAIHSGSYNIRTWSL